jgi:5-(hydroxymethyl)furfural/furfural oxidase
MLDCDYLIIGGGAAGAVMASRLSRRPDARVLLVEAGGDVDPDNVPDDIADIFPLSTFNPDYAWPQLTAHWRERGNSPALPFQQGRIMGGGSTVMGMWAVRGMPDDYDEWERQGAIGWGWSDVLPYFRRIETDVDFDGDAHGSEGPLPIRRQQPHNWSPLALAMDEVAAARGFARIDDMNADFSDGHCVLPISRHEQRRASAGLDYLNGAARARRNLQIMPQTTIEALTVADGRVSGARGRRSDGRRVSIHARHIILTAGAIHSPAILMRSGIGPAGHLQAAGIEVALDYFRRSHGCLEKAAMLAAAARPHRPICAGRPGSKARPPAIWACISAAISSGMRWVATWRWSGRS